jgi:hypothetical protein
LEPKHSLWGYPSDLNLEWQSENSVILLEDNFKDTYQGFDPNEVIDWVNHFARGEFEQQHYFSK